MIVVTALISALAISAATATLMAGRCPVHNKTAVAEFQRWMMIAGFYGWVTAQIGGYV